MAADSCEKVLKKTRRNGFEEWGGYMESKKRKLTEQFEKKTTLEQSESVLTSSNIFSGISIYVNGYTNPTAEELKRLMMVHGGIYHHYYSLKKTTYMVASNLPDSKIKNLKNKKVITPNWITDCIEAGKLLPYADYLLYTPEMINKQNRLNLKKADTPVASSSSASLQDELPNVLSNTADCVNSVTAGSSLTVHCVMPTIAESNELDIQQTNSCRSGEPARINETSNMKAGHPDFISEFYNHSRLHHISTAGQELKKYVQELAVQLKGKPFKGRENIEQLLKSNKVSPFEIKQLGTKHIMHLDMDCFFVSVGLRTFPELRGQPVAVTHSKGRKPVASVGSDINYEMQYYKKKRSEKILKLGITEDDMSDDSEKGLDGEREVPKHVQDYGSMSEIASCSYEARQSGLRNGMLLGEALRLCPNLKTIPYDFEAYSDVSKKLYDIVASYTLDIEAVSCDELYIDCTDLLHESKISPETFASLLRENVFKETGCAASAGVGRNMLLARLATRVSKPNGQFILNDIDIEEFMKKEKVKDLPGVGFATSSKLKQHEIFTCGDLQKWPIAKLQREFGSKSGQTLYDHCRGKDNRLVTLHKDRKSVSAEINYGIRFEEEKDIYSFINELAVEVQQRLRNIDKKGRSVTLKLRIRKSDAPKETAKFMGHGVCDSISKTVAIKVSTNDSNVIGSECCSIAKALKISPSDYRGLGIQVAKLETSITVTGKMKTLEHFIAIPGNSKSARESSNSEDQVPILQSDSNEVPMIPTLPAKDETQKSNLLKDVPISNVNVQNPEENLNLDMSVLNALPEDLKREVLASYAAELPNQNRLPTKLAKFSKSPVKKNKGKYKSKTKKSSPQKILQYVNKQPVSTTDDTNTCDNRVQKASLGGAVETNEVRDLVKEWVTSNKSGPIEEDVIQFRDYILQLIDEDLQKTDLLLKHFYRTVSTAGELWRESYLSILSYVQQKMLQKFGYMLKAISSFE